MTTINRETLTAAKDELRASDIPAGMVLVDKERDWTSFNVVAKLRGILKIKKIGHAGTLDPLATGLLIVCFGKATKTINEIQAQRKKYRAEIKLGAVTDSFDREFEEKEIRATDNLTDDEIVSAVNAFVGKIKQKAPMFSAKKVGGVRLYKLARQNQTVEVKESDVEIYSINILELRNPYIVCDVECSKGTYIRSLARDIGERLGVGGYLYDLRRTAIGDYSVENAVKISEISEAFI